MQEGKQEAVCLLIMGWSTTETCFVNINTSLLPYVESLWPLQKPSSALPYLAYKCMQPTGPCHVTGKWNSHPHEPGPLPLVKAAAVSRLGWDWGAITVLIENRWTQVTKGTPIHSPLGLARLKWQWQQCQPHIEMSKKKKEKKKYSETLLWLHTELHTSFNHNKKGLIQNNAMIERCRPQTSTPIVHVRTAQ